MDADALEAEIRRYLSEELGLRDAPVDRDVELVANGLIDSMDLVRLATHIERLLGISISDEDITPERFGSIARILAYVESAAGS